MANGMEHDIRVRGLRKRLKDVMAVDRIDLDVKHGDVYGLLGPNGSGKSTTIRMLLSLVYPDEGTIEIFGRRLSSNRKEILSRIGALVETPDFYEYFSAYRNLELLMAYSGIPASKSRIMEVLDLVGLKSRAFSRVKTYSKGMKQRLGLAQALVHDPLLLILDEPMNGLDPSGMKDIRNLIRYLNRDLNKTIVLSSHQLWEIEEIASRMVIINRGMVVVEGGVKELLDTAEVLVRIQADEPENAFKALQDSNFDISNISLEGDTVSLNCRKEDTAAINRYLVNSGISVSSLQTKRTLEEYFLTLT